MRLPFVGPRGTSIHVDEVEEAVEGVIVLQRQPDGSLAGVLAMKNPDHDQDEILDVLEGLTDHLIRPSFSTPKELPRD